MTRIPDSVVERVHLGEASDAERQRVLADADARARLEGLPTADAAFLARYPAAAMVSAIERKTHLRRTADAVAARQRRTLWSVGILVPIAAALGAVWLTQAPVDPSSGRDPGLERTTAKWGEGARVFVYRDAAGGQERLEDGGLASPGDRLQVRYSALDATHGVIVSIDGRGAVTLHHPMSPDGDTALQGGGERELEFGGYELDDAPRFERFFLVSDDVPVDVQGVLDAARRTAESHRDADRLPLPERLEQTTLLLRKEVR